MSFTATGIISFAALVTDQKAEGMWLFGISPEDAFRRLRSVQSRLSTLFGG